MNEATPDPTRRRRRRRRTLWIVGLLLVLLAAAALSVRGGGGPAGTEVVAEPLEQGRFLRETNGSGVVEALRERSLAFRNGGTVAEVEVEEGDVVEAGRPLLRLDVTELQRSIASTRSSLDSARAELERTVAQLRVDRLDLESAVAQANDRRLQAESDLRDREADIARVQRLLDLGAASRDELRSAQDARDAAARALEQATLSLETARTRLANQQSLIDAQRSSAEARVSQLETDLANLQARLGDAELVAPFDGVVAMLAVDPGDAAGTQPVVTIADPNELRVRASFDENRAGELAVGQRADVVPDADTRTRLPATVQRLAPVAVREGGSAQVEMLLSFDGDAVSQVRPGYTVTTRVRVAEFDEALLMPLEAITEPGSGPAYAFRIEPGSDPGRGVARRVEVQVLDRNATVAALDPNASSLEPGALIVVVGVDALSDGDEVRFPPPAGEGGRDGP
ncbi:MAG: efflux RND transporter periplasmic adaptor subunit [Trueperaceae bacterium]